MVNTRDPCVRESDFQDHRPWWEPPYVFYGFANRRVRSRLEHLMGTYVVLATDRQFMLDLQQRIREDHEDQTRKRIHNREMREVEREKLLILEGKMPMTQAPQELRNHPVIRITRLEQDILRERSRATTSTKKIKRFNYDLLAGKEEEVVEDLEMASCIDVREHDKDRVNRLDDVDEYLEELQEDIPEEDYTRIKYKDPLVEEFEEMNTVDDLYEVANEIIGTIKAGCGGMFNKERGLPQNCKKMMSNKRKAIQNV